jgi:hypothetical protein
MSRPVQCAPGVRRLASRLAPVPQPMSSSCVTVSEVGDQQVGHRLEQAVEDGLLGDPDLAAGAIPERF